MLKIFEKKIICMCWCLFDTWCLIIFATTIVYKCQKYAQAFSLLSLLILHSGMTQVRANCSCRSADDQNTLSRSSPTFSLKDHLELAERSRAGRTKIPELPSREVTVLATAPQCVEKPYSIPYYSVHPLPSLNKVDSPSSFNFSRAAWRTQGRRWQVRSAGLCIAR